MTTPDNSHTQIQQHIAQAQASEALNDTISAHVYRELQERMAEILPAWMLEYIQPKTRIDYDTATEFVTVHLPGCSPLIVVYDTITRKATDYNVRQPLRLVWNETWWVKTIPERCDDLDQALDRAALHGESYAAMQAVADRRNTAGQQPEPEPAQLTPIEQAQQFLALLSRNERIMQQPGASVDRNHATDCTLALGTAVIAIANELRRLANAVQHSNNLPF